MIAEISLKFLKKALLTVTCCSQLHSQITIIFVLLLLILKKNLAIKYSSEFPVGKNV